MKKVPWIIRIAFLVVAGAGWGLWLHDKLEQSAVSATVARGHSSWFNNSSAPGSSFTVSNSTPLNSASSGKGSLPTVPSRQQYQAYMQAQQNALRENPNLVAEEKDIIAEIDAQREKLNTAMIKADPKIAPIVAKLEAMHQKAVAMASTLRPNQNIPPPPANLAR